MISNFRRENLQAHGTGKNISGDSIVTPRERNDSAFLREKCRPGISPPPPFEGRRKSAGDETRGPERNEGRREKLVAWCRTRKNGARDPRNCFTRGDSRDIFARAYVYIYSDWHIVDTEREKEEEETSRDRITHACARIIGVKHVSVV